MTIHEQNVFAQMSLEKGVTRAEIDSHVLGMNGCTAAMIDAALEALTQENAISDTEGVYLLTEPGRMAWLTGEFGS
jgi:hypothetical protein